MFDTRNATDEEMLEFYDKQNGKCLCCYCDGCGKDKGDSWALCDDCLDGKDGKEHGISTFPMPKSFAITFDGRGFGQQSVEL